jgi:uncharacterized membrane protein YgcG
VSGGSGFGNSDRLAISNAIHKAELSSRVEFSVYVGAAEGDDPRAFATQLHNSLVAPARTIVVMVDPHARALEIVTGEWVRSRITDQEVQLAALEMKSSFQNDDLVGGITRGIHMLAEHARGPETLHAST